MRPRGTSKDLAQLPSLYHPMASSSSVAPSIVVNPFEDSQSDVQPSLTQRRPMAPRMRSNLLPISLSNSTDPATLRELGVPKPWVQNPNFRARISYWIVYVMILVGLALGEYIHWLLRIKLTKWVRRLVHCFGEEQDLGALQGWGAFRPRTLLY